MDQIDRNRGEPDLEIGFLNESIAKFLLGKERFGRCQQCGWTGRVDRLLCPRCKAGARWTKNTDAKT